MDAEQTQDFESRDGLSELTDPAMALRPFQLSEFAGNQTGPSGSSDDFELELRVEIGKQSMPMREVMKLRRGAVISLEVSAAEPVELYANEHLVARGEVLVLNENFCVRITELVGDAAQIAVV